MKKIVLIIILLFSFARHGYSLGPIYSDTLICTGSVYPFSIETPGGTWESSDTAIGKIDTTTGELTAIAAGSLTITYHHDGSSVFRKVKVRNGVTPIEGNRDVCVGDTLRLTDTTAGGTWIASYPRIATVDTTGLVTGISAAESYAPYWKYGVTAITYTIPGGCYDTFAVYVHGLGGATIPGWYDNLCVQGTRQYINADTGGRWSMYDTTFATIDSITGRAYGKAIGPDTVLYTVTNVCGTGTLKRPIYIYEYNSRACWVSVPNTNLQNSGINLYPNPVQNVLTVTTDEQYPLSSVTVINVGGTSVITQHESTNEAQIDVSALAPGIYFIHVNGREVRRVIKQ